jgi:hypothetical protein
LKIQGKSGSVWAQSALPENPEKIILHNRKNIFSPVKNPLKNVLNNTRMVS